MTDEGRFSRDNMDMFSYEQEYCQKRDINDRPKPYNGRYWKIENKKRTFNVITALLMFSWLKYFQQFLCKIVCCDYQYLMQFWCYAFIKLYTSFVVILYMYIRAVYRVYFIITILWLTSPAWCWLLAIDTLATRADARDTQLVG